MKADSRLAVIQPRSEAEFTTMVVRLAQVNGWMVYHPLPATVREQDSVENAPDGGVNFVRGRWKKVRTPLQGDRGFPDLVLARDGEVLHVELKLDGSYLRPDQKLWQAAMGDQFEVWRPSDWETRIEPRLRRR